MLRYCQLSLSLNRDPPNQPHNVCVTLTLSALVEGRPCLVSKCPHATHHSSTPTPTIPTQPSSCCCCGGGMIAREFFHHTRTLHSLSLSLILSCVSCLPHGENDSWRGCFSCFAEDFPLVGEAVFAFCVRFHRVADIEHCTHTRPCVSWIFGIHLVTAFQSLDQTLCLLAFEPFDNVRFTVRHLYIGSSSSVRSTREWSKQSWMLCEFARTS